MQIDIGQDVYTSDHQKVGRVQRFAVNPDRREVDQLVIRLGDSDATEHLVDRVKVTGETAKGLNIAMSQADIDRMNGAKISLSLVANVVEARIEAAGESDQTLTSM